MKILKYTHRKRIKNFAVRNALLILKKELFIVLFVIMRLKLHLHSFGNGYTINSDGYRYLKIGNKYVLEHRIIMEAYLNRKLKRNETIHHKDMNKLNNDISNLEVLSRAEHSRLHSKLKKKEKGVLNEKDSSSSL